MSRLISRLFSTVATNRFESLATPTHKEIDNVTPNSLLNQTFHTEADKGLVVFGVFPEGLLSRKQRSHFSDAEGLLKTSDCDMPDSSSDKSRKAFAFDLS